MGNGEDLGAPLDLLTEGHWQRSGAEIWTLIQRPDTFWQLGLSWPRNGVPEGRALRLVSDFAYQFSEKPLASQGSVLERIELRMHQMREATARIQRFRNLIRNAVGQMDDGLMVINSHGQVVMSNPRSAFYLGFDEDQDLLGRRCLSIAKPVRGAGGGDMGGYFYQSYVGE